MLSSLAPARRRLALIVAGAVLIAVIATLTVVVTSNRGSSQAQSPPATATAPGPILLVPGYGGSTSALDVLATRLRASGRAVSVFDPPGNATGDLRDQAGALARTALALRASAHAASIDVVGYSAGGVVARLWVRDYGGATVARRVVTMGSPQHGTQLAGLAGSLLPGDCPVACQQLEPGSDLLSALNAGSETPKGPAFVSIWSRGDNVVIPPESAELNGALNIEVQSICPAEKVNHSQLPTDRVVDAIVAAELTARPPVPLSASDCAQLSS